MDRSLAAPRPGGAARHTPLCWFRCGADIPAAGRILRIDITDSYDTNCLRFEPKLTRLPGDAPDDPADDGSIHWSDWARLGGKSLVGLSTWDSARFRTKADPRCATTTNRIDVVVIDDLGRRYTVSATAPLRIAAPPIGPLKVTKTLLEPANGVANVGDYVRFHVEIANTAATPSADLISKTCPRPPPAGSSYTPPWM